MALIHRLRERDVGADPDELARVDGHAHLPDRLHELPSAAPRRGLRALRGAAALGKPETGHGLIKSGASGQFGLHAKVIVIDRQRAFVGSMNFDQRSLDINTEIGIIVDSPRIAKEIAARFEAIAQPANSYRLERPTPGARRSSGPPKWTANDAIRYRPGCRRRQAHGDRIFALLPIERFSRANETATPRAALRVSRLDYPRGSPLPLTEIVGPGGALSCT